MNHVGAHQHCASRSSFTALPLTMKKTASLLSTALLSLGAALPAFAHEGHGLPGSAHWHATDAIGYVLAAGIGAALWFTRK
ncbi:MAG: hypothetical protein RLZZ592_998 [Pseudomonadota bacterium]|jgi:hypothetical protein